MCPEELNSLHVLIWRKEYEYRNQNLSHSIKYNSVFLLQSLLELPVTSVEAALRPEFLRLLELNDFNTPSPPDP